MSSAFAPENLSSRDGFGSLVPRKPAHISILLRLNMVLTYWIPPEFRDGVHFFFNRHNTLSGQSRVYRVTQMLTNGVHCRESAGTGPVINLNVVPNDSYQGKVTMGQLICASLSHAHYLI